MNASSSILDVLLINPPWTRKGGNIWKTVASVMPPHGLAVIAAVLEEAGSRVRILDTHALRIATEDLGEKLRTGVEAPPKFIGLTGSTLNISYSYETAQIARSVFPDAKIVLGGVHASEKPQEAIDQPFIDFVIRGEGEFAFRELVSGKDPSAIQGLSWRRDGKAVHNPDRELIADLDVLPMAAYHLLPMDRYFPAVGSYKNLPAISMVTSRGCPGKCTFCYQPFGSLIRQRSPGKIFDEMTHLIRTYGIREISFYDDNFTTLKPRIRELCRMLIDAKVPVTWSCFSRVDWADEGLLKTMRRAGCRQVMYGIESGDQRILDAIRKQTTLEKIRRAVQWTRDARIEVRAAFIFGNPGETEETMKKTIDFAIELDPDVAIFNVVVPNPGTQMYDWAVKNGVLKTEDWSEYDLTKPVMTLSEVSGEKVQAAYRLAYRKFYMRPRYVLKKLFGVRTVADVRSIFSGLKGVLNVVGR